MDGHVRRSRKKKRKREREREIGLFEINLIAALHSGNRHRWKRTNSVEFMTESILKRAAAAFDDDSRHDRI
jgi:hypothetical protein